MIFCDYFTNCCDTLVDIRPSVPELGQATSPTAASTEPKRHRRLLSLRWQNSHLSVDHENVSPIRVFVSCQALTRQLQL